MNTFAFQWHITEECDQRCEHCYIFTAGQEGLPLATADASLINKTIESCLSMARDLGREPYFFITGGDPILHPQFWPILERLQVLGVRFSILGNPFHLTEEVCLRLRALGCERYQLSLDGLEATHDRIRMPGSFAATLAAVPVLQSAGIRVAVMATVSKTNCDEIPSLIDTVVAHGVDVFSFGRYCSDGPDPATQMEPLAYRDFLGRCAEKFAQHRNSETWFDKKDHLWKLWDYEQGQFTIDQDLDPEMIYDGCHCGNSHLTILPTGAIHACRRVPSPIGNVLTDNLTTVFTGPSLDRYRDYTRFEKCSRCELLRFCRGCPAVAYGTNGDFYSPDPQCWKVVS